MTHEKRYKVGFFTASILCIGIIFSFRNFFEIQTFVAIAIGLIFCLICIIGELYLRIQKRKNGEAARLDALQETVDEIKNIQHNQTIFFEKMLMILSEREKIEKKIPE